MFWGDLVRRTMVDPALQELFPDTCLYSLILMLLSLSYYAQKKWPISSYVHVTLHTLLHFSLSLHMLIPLPGMPLLALSI